MKIVVLKVCGPCNEFPEVDNTKFENLSCFMYQQYIESMYGHALYMYGHVFILGILFPIICENNYKM